MCWFKIKPFNLPNSLLYNQYNKNIFNVRICIPIMPPAFLAKLQTIKQIAAIRCRALLSMLTTFKPSKQV